jgi:hypothetical protein
MSEYVEKEEVLKQIDCWFMTGEYKYSNATHYLDKRISSIKPNSEWISVKDRMPEEGVDVLVYGYIYLNRKGADVDFVDRESGDFFYYDEGEVTHWRPLPEPPESAEIMEAIAGSEAPDKAERSTRT